MEKETKNILKGFKYYCFDSCGISYDFSIVDKSSMENGLSNTKINLEEIKIYADNVTIEGSLNINGTLQAENYLSNNSTQGISTTINVKNYDINNCTIIVENGLIVAITC